MKWRVADFLVIAVVILCAVGIWLYPTLSPVGAVAKVRYGDSSKTVSLSTDAVLNLNNATITVKNGEIAITDAVCPDRVCVNTGKISKEGQSIVCVPNEIVITIEGASAVDAISN